MNNKKYLRMTVLAVSIVLIFIAAMTIPDDASFLTHKVKKGESVSLLCLEIYGHYSKELGAAFVKDNPAVKNINLIYVGQKIRFRKPITDLSKATKEDSAVVQVFFKKVNATQGVVTYVEGRARLTKAGQKTSEKLSPNALVYPGDMIKTGDNGRVELIINRESVVRLKENTELTIETFRDNEKNEGKTSLNFSVGSLWSKLKKYKDNISRFELELPTAIAGVHGTVYQTTVNSDTSAELKVYDGEVEVSGKHPKASVITTKPVEISGPYEIAGPHEVSMEEWTRIVRTMQSITINKQGVPSDASSFQKDPNSSWEKWNEERDQRIAEIFMEL